MTSSTEATTNISTSSGRIIGALFLTQMIGGILVNFTLTSPLFGNPGFIVNGAVFENQIGMSALLGMVISSLSLVIAILVYPTFKQNSPALALGFLILSSIGLALSAVEQMGVMGMVSYSKTYAGLAAADQGLLESMKGIVASIRNWGHYTNLLFSGATLMVFYITLFRFKLVPLFLAGFGIIAVITQLSTIAMPFFGYGVDFMLLAPLALCQLSLSLWLMVKGFRV